MSKSPLLFCSFLIAVILSAWAFAEPYLAIREGLKCSACHVNMTGGGKRTRMGSGYGVQELVWKPLDLQSRKIPSYWSIVDDRLSVGADFRFQNTSTFEKDHTFNSFQTDKSDFYIQGDLIPDTLTFYLDESVSPGGAQAREIFALLRKLPGRGWVKAGKFVLPYGLRLEDDRAFIREMTGFTFLNPDTGIEIGFEPGNFTFSGFVTNGSPGSSDTNASKQVGASAGYVTDFFRIGGSASYNDSGSEDRRVAGLWSGFRIGKIVFLGEADFIRDRDPLKHRNRIATHAEVDYEIIHGWNVKAAYEYYDPDTDVDEDERDRLGIGVEPFITSFVQLQLFYRFNQSIPQNLRQNADDFYIRLHLYF